MLGTPDEEFAAFTALREAFRAWLDVKIAEGDYAAGTTLWFGVTGKCCWFLESLVKGCVECLLPAAGHDAEALLAKVAGGKPADRLTLGQRLAVLQNLAKHNLSGLHQLAPEIFADVFTEANSTFGAQPASARLTASLRTLAILTEMRNAFAHARWSDDMLTKDYEESRSLTETFFRLSSNFCRSPLVDLVAKLDDAKT